MNTAADVRWVGLVRNVMLGREGLHRTVLLEIAADAGATDVVSVGTTGNLLFTASTERLDDVIGAMEHGIAGVLGRSEPVIVRAADWLREFLRSDPFTADQHGDCECEVAFVSHGSPPLERAALPRSGRTDIVAIHERELVTARPRTGGDRPHVNRLLQQATGARATARGWNSLIRIAAAATPAGQ